MSAALVRQALEFVDPDETKSSGKRKRGTRSRVAGGQETVAQVQTKSVKVQTKASTKKDIEKSQEVISKLLKLSETTVNKELSDKIVKRAVSGKPLFDKIEVQKEEEKSILFPEDDPPKKKKKKYKKSG